MMKLMKLEWKKNHLTKYIKGTLVSTCLIFMISTFMDITSQRQGELMFTDFNSYMSFVNIIIRVVFVIFSAVLLSRLVVDEFKNKTLQLLFTYPVNRKLVIKSKLLLVVGFCFISILFSTIAISLLSMWMNPIVNLFPKVVQIQDVIYTLPNIFTSSLTTACLSLIPLYFGMKKKSSSTTITWGVVIGLLVNATVSDGTGSINLAQTLIIPLILAFVGLMVTFMTFRHIETQDVL